MISVVTGHQWSEESLFHKARLYIERMETHPPDDWQFGFWSALSLELFSRAALAHISPVLLADNRNWRNVAHALGQGQSTVGFSPRSIPLNEVFDRLKELLPVFNSEIVGFCRQHTKRRNSELHSGELPFENLKTAEWLPMYYLACDALLGSTNRKLEDFVLAPAETREMINSFQDTSASTVREDVEGHKQGWSNKSVSEQEKASEQAEIWATRHEGHRAECPACSSQALLQGTAAGPVTTEIGGDEVVQRQTMLPSSFECIACGLRISGLSKLSTSGLGNAGQTRASANKKKHRSRLKSGRHATRVTVQSAQRVARKPSYKVLLLDR